MEETQEIPNKYHQIMIGAIATFLCITTLPMFKYPGGNSLNPSATTYDFWINVFSDLGTTTTNRNEANTFSSILFSLAMEEFGIIVIFIWNKIPVKNRIFAARHRRYGTLCGVGLCIIGLTPFNIVPTLHAIGVGIWLIGYLGLVNPHNITPDRFQYLSKRQLWCEHFLFWITVTHFIAVLLELVNLYDSLYFIPISQKIVVYGLFVYHFLITQKNV